MGYGTGAIMAVPAHDQRDFEFATEFDLAVTCVIQPPDEWLRDHGVDADTPAGDWPEAFVGDGVGVHSTNADVSLDGLGVADAKAAITDWLVAQDLGEADGQLQAARLALQPSALLG